MQQSYCSSALLVIVGLLLACMDVLYSFVPANEDESRQLVHLLCDAGAVKDLCMVGQHNIFETSELSWNSFSCKSPLADNIAGQFLYMRLHCIYSWAGFATFDR